MAGLSMGLGLLALVATAAPLGASPELQELATARAAALRIGFVVALASGAGLALLGWRQRRSSSAPPLLHQLGLAACALWAAASLGPLGDSTFDLIERLGDWGVWSALGSGDPLSGVALVPALAVLSVPALALGAVVPLTLGSVGTLLLARAASPRFAASSLAAATLSAGFLVACFLMLQLANASVDAFGRWMESADLRGADEARELFDAARAHLALLGSATLGLLWPCLAAIGLAGYAIVSPRGAAAPLAGQPATRSLRPALAPALGPDLEPAPGFEHDAYRIRLRTGLFTSFLRPRLDYEIAPGAGDRSSLRAHRDALAGVIQVTRLGDGGDVLQIRRRAGWPMQRWEILAAPTGESLGMLRRQGPMQASWQLLDGIGQELASVLPTGIALRSVQYEIASGGRSVCTCRWSVPSLLSMRPELDLDFGRHREHGFDRRLGLAIGLILEPHARFRAHVYAS